MEITESMSELCDDVHDINITYTSLTNTRFMYKGARRERKLG